MVRGITVEEEIKRIEEFFNNLSIEEFEQICIDNGMHLKENECKLNLKFITGGTNNE